VLIPIIIPQRAASFSSVLLRILTFTTQHSLFALGGRHPQVNANWALWINGSAACGSLLFVASTAIRTDHCSVFELHNTPS
jgi:hypothetical protein